MFHYSESCKAATSEPKDGVVDSKPQLVASVRNGVILPHLDVLCDLLMIGKEKRPIYIPASYRSTVPGFLLVKAFF